MAKAGVYISVIGDSKVAVEEIERAEAALGQLKAEAATTATGFSAAFSRMQDKLDAWGTKLTNAGKQLTTKLTLPLVALGVVAVKQAADDQAAQEKLAQVLHNTVGAHREVVDQVEARIAKWQRETGILDDDLRPAYQSLVGATHDVGKSNSLMNQVIDISIAKHKDVNTVALAVAKAYAGNVGALGRLGISTKDATGKTLSFDAVMQRAAATFGGVAARNAQTAAGKLQILRARMSELFETIGGLLLPVVEKIAGWLGTVADSFGHLSPTVQRVIVVIAALAAVLGPLLLVAGALATAIAAVSLPVLAVIAAVGALVAAGIFLVAHWDEIGPKIQAAIAPVVDWLRSNVVPTVRAVVAFIIAEWNEVATWTREHWDQIQEAISHVLAFVEGVVRFYLAAYREAWSLVGDEIIAVVVAAWSYVKTTIENVLHVIEGIVEFVMAVINGDWDAAWQAILKILSAVGDQIIATARFMVDTILAVIRAGLDVLNAAWSFVWGLIVAGVSGALNAISGVVSGGIDQVVGFVTELPGRVAGFAWNMLLAGASLGRALLDGIGNAISGAVDWAATAGKNIANAVIDAFNSVVGKLNDAIPDISFLGVTIIPDDPIPRIPKLHTGGVARFHGSREGLALLADGEVVFREDQLAALANAGLTTTDARTTERHVHYHVTATGSPVVVDEDYLIELLERMTLLQPA